MGCEPSFTISLRMLSLVEQVAALIVKAPEKLAIRPRQEQLLKLLRDHGSMTPAELWAALGVSCQGAMDLLLPLQMAGSMIMRSSIEGQLMAGGECGKGPGLGIMALAGRRAGNSVAPLGLDSVFDATHG